ncbi:MAG: SpoIIE family protein phosphatase [Pseudonocardiaceae bacterium]
MDSWPSGRLGDNAIVTAERLLLLQEVTSALAHANDLAEVADTVMSTIKGAVGAEVGVLCVIDEEAFSVLATAGLAETVARQWREFPIDAPLPACDAVRRSHSILIRSRAERDAAYSLLKDAPMEHQSWVILPLITEEEAVGVLACGWTAPGGFDEATNAWLQAVADQCAAAVHRGRLLAAEQSARAMLEVLVDASQVLSSSLDPQVTLQRLTRIVLPVLGDGCMVHLLDDHGLELAELAHVDPDQEHLLRRLTALVGGYAQNEQLLAVVRTGEPLLLAEVPPGTVAQAARSGEQADLLTAVRIRSALAVPLVAHGRTLGTLSLLLSSGDRRYTNADIRLVQDLATRAAVALANAQAHARLADIAHTLQQSLLPPRLPSIPGLQLAARYEPLGEGVEVGGDFYDVFPLGKGRWGITMGDVVGKGVAAAALTSLARHTVRVAARRRRSPAAVLAELNDAVMAADVGQPFLTIVYLTVMVDSEAGAQASIALGGHPRPLLLSPGRAPQPVGRYGQLIGMLPKPRIQQETVLIEPGQSLVLYTDGLIEARSATGKFSEPLLLETLTSLSGQPAERIAQEAIDVILRFQPRPSDDMAILVFAPEHRPFSSNP